MKSTERNVILLFILLFVGLNSKISVAQTPRDINFNHITNDQGLSQSTVNDILQDSEGFMWFATQDGLNRYNGYEITIYKNDPDDPHSLSLNEVQSLYEDRDGNLWIGTLGGGVNLYDRMLDRFIQFKGDLNRPTKTLSDNSIWAMYEDDRGNFWIGTSWGLNKMKKIVREDTTYLTKVTHYVTQPDNPESISSNNVSSIFEDSRGTFWVATERGLNILNRETGEFKRFLHNPGNPNSIGSNQITTIYEDESGRLWIGTMGGGLNYYHYENQHFHKYVHDDDDPGSISENSVYGILEDNNGVLWIGTSNNGLDIFDRSSERFYQFSYNQKDPHSINNDAINSIYESRENIIWIGTFAGGVNFIDPKKKKFEHYKNDPRFSSSLSHNVVRSFLETSSGKFFVGTDGGGLNIFNRKTSQFTVLKHDPDNYHTIPGDVILDMEENQNGNIWLGTYNGGLSLYDPENQTFQHYQHDPENTTSLSSNDIFELFEDRKERLWIGTNGGGINMLKPESDSFVHYMEDPKDSSSIDNNDIRSLYEDSQGNFWIGSYGGQLTRFDRETNRFEYFDINKGNLYSSVIQSIHEDDNNDLWLGTRGGGLKLFDPETSEVKSYSKKDGLPSNIINGILSDNQGNLWISSNEGLSKFDPESETVTNYGLEDGLQGLEFTSGSYYKDRQGYMYFGGVNGFNRFHPDSVTKNPEVPPVILTDFQLFNRSVSVGGNSPLKKQISQTDRIVLPYDSSVFTFKYATLNFSSIRGIQYAYKLEGFDNEWNFVEEKRTATYTNLDPGEYHFKLKAANSDGVWGEETNMVSLVITPPFWQTIWFYCLSALLVVGLVTYGYRWRVRSIREQNRKLEQEVATRTADLESALEELKSTRDELVRKAHKAGMADIASEVLHNVGNILNSVNTSASIVNETAKKSKIEELARANTILRENLEDIEEFIAENPKGKPLLKYYLKLEEPLKGEQNKIIKQTERLIDKINLINEVIAAQQSYAGAQMEADQLELSAMIDDALALQVGSIDRHELTVQKELRPIDPIEAQRSKLIHVLVNLIKNAKEAMSENDPEEKAITIKTWQDHNRVYLSISDNGPGIPEEDVKKIFTHGFSTKSSGHGFGLHSSANYMKEMKGEITVDNNKNGRGAIFTLIFQKSPRGLRKTNHWRETSNPAKRQ